MSKLNYADFEKEILNGQKYSDRNLKMIFLALSEMDKESRKWYIRFVLTGTYPDAEIEGYTVKDLVENLNYTNTQAFLVFDWLKDNPEEAKFFITSNFPSLEMSSETVDKMREYLIKNGVDPDMPLEIPDSISDEE